MIRQARTFDVRKEEKSRKITQKITTLKSFIIPFVYNLGGRNSLSGIKFDAFLLFSLNDKSKQNQSIK